MRSCPILLGLRYNGSSVSGAVLNLSAAKLKPFIACVSGLALYCVANKFIVMITLHYLVTNKCKYEKANVQPTSQ
jgi:hypothetical protein